jgi:hypothetical protein
VSSVTGGIIIRGESAGTILVQQGIAEGETMQAVDTFDVSDAGNPGQYGVRFRDLRPALKENLLPMRVKLGALFCALVPECIAVFGAVVAN